MIFKKKNLSLSTKSDRDTWNFFLALNLKKSKNIAESKY